MRRKKLEYMGMDFRFVATDGPCCPRCALSKLDVEECYSSNSGYFCKGGYWVKDDAGKKE